jgi:hypothetical protein
MTPQQVNSTDLIWMALMVCLLFVYLFWLKLHCVRTNETQKRCWNHLISIPSFLIKQSSRSAEFFFNNLIALSDENLTKPHCIGYFFWFQRLLWGEIKKKAPDICNTYWSFPLRICLLFQSSSGIEISWKRDLRYYIFKFWFICII